MIAAVVALALTPATPRPPIRRSLLIAGVAIALPIVYGMLLIPFIDRDVKVEIVALDMHWNGAVTVEGPDRRRIRHGLGLERPLTKEAFEEKLNRLFWFKHPDYRYRMNLRKYGKKTAKAVYNHELFKGMKREAALESWGFPDEMNSNEVSGGLQEQWIYRDPRQTGKKRYIYIANGLVDNWEE